MAKTNAAKFVKKPAFAETGVRTFRNFPAGERLTGWSQSALADGLFRAFLALWLAPLLFCLVYILWNFRQLPDQIPLFYSRPWGETQLASRWDIFLPAAGAFLLGIFNFSLSVNWHSRDKVFAYLLAATGVILSFLAAITSVKIVNLVK